MVIIHSFQAFKYFPSNISTISWLGAYYIDAQFVEKAMHYFEKAALVQYVLSCCLKNNNIAVCLHSFEL